MSFKVEHLPPVRLSLSDLDAILAVFRAAGGEPQLVCDDRPGRPERPVRQCRITGGRSQVHLELRGAITMIGLETGDAGSRALADQLKPLLRAAVRRYAWLTDSLGGPGLSIGMGIINLGRYRAGASPSALAAGIVLLALGLSWAVVSVWPKPVIRVPKDRP